MTPRAVVRWRTKAYTRLSGIDCIRLMNSIAANRTSPYSNDIGDRMLRLYGYAAISAQGTSQWSFVTPNPVMWLVLTIPLLRTI